jgi:hypothetical protein
MDTLFNMHSIISITVRHYYLHNNFIHSTFGIIFNRIFFVTNSGLKWKLKICSEHEVMLSIQMQKILKDILNHISIHKREAYLRYPAY